MARASLSTKVTIFALLTAPASLALAAQPSAAVVRPSDQGDPAAGVPRHGRAPVRACSIKAADHLRHGEQAHATGTGFRPHRSAQLWIEGAKASEQQRIGKHGRVNMTFRVSQAPGHHPAWITDGVNRCDVPGGMTVKK
jgi:hypothetical protein